MSIGTTRNLTQQFRKFRDEAKRAHPASEDRATAVLINSALGGSTKDIELGSITSTMAPAWVLKAEKIRTEFSTLKERLAKLKQTHAKALMVTFDTENDSESHAEALTRDIQGTFKRLDFDIRGIVQPQAAAAGGDVQVQEQVQKQLAQVLLLLSKDFRQEQTRFLNKVEQQKGLTAGSTLGMVTSDSQVSLDSVDPGFNQMQLQLVDVSQSVALERDEEIRKIVETITELATIMQDLATLVVEQGTILDRIDKNIEKVAESVEAGLKEVVKAEKTQKAGRMMMCIIALIVLIVIMLIIVIVRHA